MSAAGDQLGVRVLLEGTCTFCGVTYTVGEDATTGAAVLLHSQPGCAPFVARSPRDYMRANLAQIKGAKGRRS